MTGFDLSRLPPASELPVIVIAGPTASGKTGVACQLYDLPSPLHTLPNGFELVSMDSALVYRGMDIGTAKPTHNELQRYPHHLIDILEPEDAYSAAQFMQDANRLIQAAHQTGKIPVIVGGTMLYLKAWLEGIGNVPATDAGVRAQVAQELCARGLSELYRELQAIDPLTACRLKPTDNQRITRALEVFRMTGVTISNWQKQPKLEGVMHDLHLWALIPERDLLHQRIEERLTQMWERGFLEEVNCLRQRPYLTTAHPAMRAVGYRQAMQYLLSEIKDINEMKQRALFATRQLAKRQYTWLRKLTESHRFHIVSTPNLDRLPLSILESSFKID